MKSRPSNRKNLDTFFKKSCFVACMTQYLTNEKMEGTEKYSKTREN